MPGWKPAGRPKYGERRTTLTGLASSGKTPATPRLGGIKIKF